MAVRNPDAQSDKGSKYEISVTAYLASHLSKDENVKDYRLFSNLNEAKPLDDIVAEVYFKGSEQKQLYAIQVKSGRVDFDLRKYSDEYAKIMETGGLNLGGSVLNNHIQFWYFCNKNLAEETFYIERNNRKIRLKTRLRSKPYNIHEAILYTTVYGLSSNHLNVTHDQGFLDSFYLFQNQPDSDSINEFIKKQWNINDSMQLLSYIDNYFAKTKNALDKATFEHELLKNSLSHYVVTPTRAIEFEHKAVDELNRLINEKTVTVVYNETNIEQYIFGCILQNISDVISIDEWNRCIDNVGKLEKVIKDRFKEKPLKPETLKDIVIHKWVDGKIPLVLRSGTTLPFLKDFSHLDKSYIIIDSDIDKRYDEIKRDGLRVFRDLGDVEAEKLMSDILVSLQGRKPVSLGLIVNTDKRLMKSVTFVDIINMMKPREIYLKPECLDGNNSILFIIESTNTQQQNNDECRPTGNNITKYCKPGESYENYERTTRDSIFRGYVILCLSSTDERLTLLRKTKEHGTAQEEEKKQILGGIFVDQHGESIYYRENKNPVPIIGEVLIRTCSRYVPRYLRQIKVNSSSGGDSDKSKVVYNSKRFAENDFFKESAGMLTVITGEPGVGKTTLLHSLSYLCESQYYVVFVNLTHCQVNLRKRSTQMLENPLRFLCDKYGLPYSCFLNKLCDYQDRVVLLLDAFDEVVATCEKQVLEFIQSLLNIGLKKIIIASRLTFVSLLTDTFKTEVFLIEGFNQQFDKHYIENWNLNFNSLDHLPPEFLTNPLYLNMLRTISNNGINLDVVTNRWNLYQSIVDLKMQEYCRRKEPHLLDENEKRYILSHHWQLALEVVFGSCNVIQKLQRTKPTKQVKPLKHNNFINLGFITHFDINQNPIFIHHTFAEFFVLQWLIENIDDDNAASIYMLMLTNKMHVLDMLSEQLPLHKAVLHESVEEMEKLCIENNDHLPEVDDLGRSVLHLAAIICGRDFYRKSKLLNMLLHRMRMKGCDIYVPDKIMKWTWINYWENHLYVFKWWKDEYIVTLEAYLNYYATHIEKLKHSKFSLAEHFNRFYNAAIKFSSINMIRDLLFLKYHDDKIFLKFRDILSQSRMIKWEELLNLKFRGENLQDVHLACIYSNIEAVKIYIENRANFSKTDIFNCTPLHYSVISRENNEIVKLLLANSDVSNLYAGQDNDTTILHMSVRAGNANVTRMLLEGIDANLKDADNSTALLAVIESSNINSDGALDSKHLETIEMLLQHKAVADFKALDLATKYGKRDILQMLIKYGANVSINGYTLLHKAIQAENLEIIELLLKNDACISLADFCRWDLLSYAIYGGSNDVVEMLLHYNPDVNLKNRQARTPLYVAIDAKNLEIIKLLLKRGAKVNILDLSGYSPLSYASDVGNKDIVQMLSIYNTDVNLNKKAPSSAIFEENVQKLADYSVMPLYNAISKNDLKAIEHLVKYGMHVNDLDSKGQSPLSYAVSIGNKDTVEMLLTCGADVNLKDKNNDTPLHKAIKTNDLEIIELLLKSSAKVDILDSAGWSSLANAVHQGSKDTIEMLLHFGADVNFKNNNDTPLHKAIKTNDLEIIELLLKFCAQIDVLDSDGWSPLIYAVLIGNKDTVKMLLTHGANINFKNNNDRTALFAAIEKQDLKMIELVLKSNAHVNIVDSKDWSPLGCAVYVGNKDIIKILLTYGADVKFKDNKNSMPPYDLIQTKALEINKLVLESGGYVNILDSMGWSPLDCAVHVGKKGTVEMLLTCDAKATYKNNDRSAMYSAIEKNDLEMIELALKSGAHVNILDSNEWSPLGYAIHVGNKETVEMLLIHGADVNFKNNNDRTALYATIEKKDLEIMKLVLKSSAHIDILDSNGMSPLDYAVDVGNKETVEMLLTHGADVNFKNNNDRTALYATIEKKDLEIMKLVLESGAHIDILDSNGMSPLDYAVDVGNKETVEMLLTYDANVNFKNNVGRTVLYATIGKKDLEMIKLVLKSDAHVNILDLHDWSPLGYAIYVGIKDTVEILLSHGADPNLRGKSTRTPIFPAIYLRNFEIIKLLLKYDAHMSIWDLAGVSLLSYAVQIGYKDTVEMLLTHGADVNFKNRDGRTALYDTIQKNNLEMIELVLKFGALVNILDLNGWSPLGYAVHVANKDTVEILLSHDADPNLRGKRTHTPIYQAIYLKDLEVIELLLKHAAHMSIWSPAGVSVLSYAVQVGYKDTVEMLLTYGADVNFKNHDGRTALYTTIDKEDLEMIELVLKSDAHVNSQDPNGWIPLSYAVQVGNKETVEMLLTYGADVNFKDNNNRTALYATIEKKDLEIMKLVLESGAHVNILDSNEMSPLGYAVHVGSKDIVEMLLTYGADVNFKNRDGRTALYASIQKNDLEIIELVLKSGAHINILDSNEMSPLGYAVQVNNTEAVEMLLTYGAYVNFKKRTYALYCTLQ